MNNPMAPPLQSIYPVLEGPQDDQVFVATEQKTCRLQHISRLQRLLEDERDIRAALYKKYHRGVNVLDGIDTTLITVSMGLRVGLLSTIVAAPVVLGLEAGSLACGILAVAGKYAGRRLATKAKKHDEIRVANSKLNTVADHVSTALKDGEISDREFRLVLDELAKYYGMRDEIRAGAKSTCYGCVRYRNKKRASSARANRGPPVIHAKTPGWTLSLSLSRPPPAYV